MLKYTFHLRNKCWPFSAMARSGKCGVVLRKAKPKGFWEDGSILRVATTCSWEMSASLSYWEPRRSMQWMSISFANPFTRGEIWHISYHWCQLLGWWITASSIVVTQELFAKRLWVSAIPCNNLGVMSSNLTMFGLKSIASSLYLNVLSLQEMFHTNVTFNFKFWMEVIAS